MSDSADARARLLLLENAVARLNDIILITDANPIDEPGPRIVFVNEAFGRYMGYGRDEVIGLTPRILQGPKTQRRELDRIRAAMEAFRPVRAELINYTKAGDERWLELDIVPICDGEGRCTHFVAVERDVTERKQAEAEAREMKQRLETLVSNANVGLIVHRDLKPIMANGELARLFGYASVEDIMALPDCGLLFAEHERSRINDYSRRRVTGGAPPDFYNVVGRKADGSAIDLESRAFAIRWGEEMAVCAMITDVTRQRSVEAQLRQAQRLEAIGQLTGGIAHDFNNLLTVILGNADVLVDRLADDEALQPLADMIKTAAERGADLTNRLLSFGRRQALDPRTTDVNELLLGMASLLRRTLGEHIEIGMLRERDLARAFIDGHQLENAVLNLSINARDAMPDGGSLTIETINGHLSAVDDLPDDVTPGDYVTITVADTGAGMPPEVLARAFEPFFTTKDIGRGSGLGLSMVYGFVKQSSGHITIQSEHGRGTIVRIYLPQADDRTEPEKAAPRDPAPTGNAETILLVEDDDLVRELAAELLLSLGYKVVEAGSGPEAMARLRQFSHIDVLFTDMVMPGGMTGSELAVEARKMFPDLPVLFASGYEDTARADIDQTASGLQIIAKPYRLAELANRIQQALYR